MLFKSLIPSTALSILLSPSAVDPGLVSLSLAYSISLAGMFQYGVRMGTEVEGLVSVEADKSL